MNLLKIYKPKTEFKPARYRTKVDVKSIVIHWTGGRPDRDIEDFVGILNNSKVKGLGYHYVIMLDGKVYQLADPEKQVCSHVSGCLDRKSINEHTIGIALMGAGHGKFKSKRPEDLSTSVIHGRTVVHDKPPEIQIQSLIRLVWELCTEFGINKSVCTGRTKMAALQWCYYPIAGHFHFSKRKVDPGFDTMVRVEEGLQMKTLKLGDDEGGECGLD